MPAGYLEARNTGSAAAMHPALAAYYERLRLLLDGPLLARERLATGFQLGAYDPLLVEYLASQRP